MQRTYCRMQRGMVYAMTNATDNEVIAFCRNYDGRLTRMKSYPTGGNGTGAAVVDPLASQGSLILSDDGYRLFAVNAGSNSISSFRVHDSGSLSLVDVEPSGGIRPNSLGNRGNILYVSNLGDSDNNISSNITGFIVKRDGRLTPIDGATYSLSTPEAQPACVVFNPEGCQLVVTELNTNVLSVFCVQSDGTLIGPTVNNSNGGGPFGSVFLSTGLLLVSEAGANALSSYTASKDGTLNVISGSIPNGQTAVCWVVPSRFEHFAFTSNTGSGTITTYYINKANGTLNTVKIAYSVCGEIAAPIDSGVSKDGCNYYVLNGAQGSISAFKIKGNGQLILLQVIEDVGLPTLGAQGLAVR